VIRSSGVLKLGTTHHAGWPFIRSVWSNSTRPLALLRHQGAAANPIHYEYTTMATRKLKIAKLKAHIQAICDLIDESDASMTGGKDKVLDLAGPEPDVKSPDDEHRTGNAQDMRTAFPGFDRLKKL
jgi:hypothetical protein